MDALGFTGNAILSRFQLKNVTVDRAPGIEQLYGVKSELTADGYELRLGGRMTLYASIAAARLGCFHLQMKCDKRYPAAWQAVGRRTLNGIQRQIDAVPQNDIILLGGDGWQPYWCNNVGVPNLHPYVGGDWICGRNVTLETFKRVLSGGVSDHNMFVATLRR